MKTLCLIYVWACRVLYVSLGVVPVVLLAVIVVGAVRDGHALAVTGVISGVVGLVTVIVLADMLYEKARARLEEKP